MIYAIIVLSVALWGTFWWIVGLKGRLKSEKKENSCLREDRYKLQKENIELNKDIYELVEGGLIQQEAVQIKYKAQYQRQRDFQKFSMDAHRAALKQSGLANLGSIPNNYWRSQYRNLLK